MPTKMEKKVNLDPEGRRRRRNSYTAAIEEDNMLLEPLQMTTRIRNIDEKLKTHKMKLLNTNSRHEFQDCSESLSLQKSHCGATRTPSTTSGSSSGQEIDVLRVLDRYPELLNAIIGYQRTLKNNSTIPCSCRKDSLSSAKESSSTLSVIRYQDSIHSIFPSQGYLIPGSERYLANRRHSDHMPWRYYETHQRRLSDQPGVRLWLGNNFQSPSHSTTMSRPTSSLTRDSERSLKSTDRCSSINAKQKRNLIRHDSETSIKSSQRGSISPITPKMMRRRFSEQLILEGGLTYEPEFEELVEEDPEESLTAINARKKVTLKRHYYPEGYWGYVVTIVAIIVQIICHGVHTSSGVLLSSTATIFNKSMTEAGIYKIFFFFFGLIIFILMCKFLLM